MGVNILYRGVDKHCASVTETLSVNTGHLWKTKCQEYRTKNKIMTIVSECCVGLLNFKFVGFSNVHTLTSALLVLSMAL